MREQERYIALQIRREVNRRREHEIQILAEELKQDWERQQKEKLETLHKLYQESLQLLGEGHRSAKENVNNLTSKAQQTAISRPASSVNDLSNYVRSDFHVLFSNICSNQQSTPLQNRVTHSYHSWSCVPQEPDWEAIAQKHEENHNRAAERYHNALKELKSQRQKEQEEQNR